MYMVAALLVVPSLLALFHRLSRTPTQPGRVDPETEGSTSASDPVAIPEAMSLADEAERWLQGRKH
jgi:hypothetical protein